MNGLKFIIIFIIFNLLHLFATLNINIDIKNKRKVTLFSIIEYVSLFMMIVFLLWFLTQIVKGQI